MNIKSYAKINLILNLGKKIGNYHEFESVMTKITLADDMEIFAYDAEEPELEISWNLDTPVGKRNTIIIAYEELTKIRNLGNKKIEVKIIKHIPMEGGLGGGSSNAATFINALDKILKLELTLSEKYEIGAKIGMDVNFFFTDSVSVASGFGSTIKDHHVKLPNWYILLVKPEFGCSTKKIYKNFKSNNSLIKASPMITTANYLHNDLEKVAYQLYPELDVISKDLNKNGAMKSLLCGSGSTIAGFFESKSECIKAKEKLAEKYFFVEEVKFYNE